MSSHRVTVAALCLLAVCAGAAWSDETTLASRQARTAAERGLAFLEKDALQWRKERKCASCHHGTMTVWALSEARSQGYAVNTEALADFVKWTKERLKDIDKP